MDRPLTIEEWQLIEWMLKNSGREGTRFLNQLAKARVRSLCPCGCASINLAVNGLPPAPPGVHVLADFLFGDESNLSGIFVFESDGILSGLEVYGLAADAPRSLPKSAELRPFEGSSDRT